MSQQSQRHWYNDRALFLHGLARSNYVTAITDWFMSFAGKWAELVLYGTVLYSCAELYPGVTLPAGLSLGVFLVQLGALDIGGLSLAKLAKQAREDGNAAGAANAETLSKWLIGIMLVGVVTVGLEHALPVALPSWVTVSIDVALVVARSICAVLYGRVVHDLKHEMARMMPVADAQAAFIDLAQSLERHVTDQVIQLEATVGKAMIDLSERLPATDQGDQLTDALQPILGAIQEHTRMLQALAALPARLEEMERSLSSVTSQKAAAPTARLSVVGTQRPTTRSRQNNRPTDARKVDKGGFVRRCLTDDPTMRTSDIQRLAAAQGITIAHSYISDIRKAFTEEQSA